MRYPLVDGQGNFGSVDGDPPAAMRYTEVRMTKLAQHFLTDIQKDTVDFTPNYDGSLTEPVVLPTPIPNLLINGSAGIAVGMATNIPPHNLTEICEGLKLLIDNPDVTPKELMRVIQGPDFPTAGFILGRKGIQEAYETGRGIIKIRARAYVEKVGANRERIIISEIPYQVNKAKLLEKIAELVREKKVEGVTDIRDESDREGMRIVVEVKRDANAMVILNRLYKYTQMEISLGIILLAIANGRPVILNLKQILQHFIGHRKEVVLRRTRFDLERAEQRAHILEGLKKALDFLDEIIELIRSSTDPKDAKQRLISEFEFSEAQAQAILDMRLQRLTGLERDKINSEYEDLIKNIERFRAILSNPSMVMQIIRDEVSDIQAEYGDDRRTEILNEEGEIDLEDLIAEEDMVVTISHRGYIKRNPITLYRAQRRGGKGLMGVKIKEEDFVESLFVASSHDYLLFFTTEGRVHWRKVHEIPEAGRAARGKAIVNLLNLRGGERVATTLSVRDFGAAKYLVMATKKGLVKKSELSLFSRPRSIGIAAIRINEGDELIDVRMSNGDQDILLSTRHGKCIRFHETDLRPVGRVAVGNIGIRLAQGDEVVGMEVLTEGATVLTVTENGYGKRTRVEEFRVQSRGGKGVFLIKCTPKNGPVVGSCQVKNHDEIMIITEHGMIIRVRAIDISVIGRNTQGVKLIHLEQGQRVVGLAKVVED